MSNAVGSPRVTSAHGRRAIVVGGSLGGLTAACWLRDAGFQVQVFERSSVELEDRGAGIVLHPAAVRLLLEKTGLCLDELGPLIERCYYLDLKRGVVADGPCKLRSSSYGKLLRRLSEFLGSPGVTRNANVIDIDADAVRPRVRLADGSTHGADLVVFADGIGSTGRSLLLPECSPVYAGYVAWRGVIPGAMLTARTTQLLSKSISYSLTADGHLLTYPIWGSEGTDLQVNWLWYRDVRAAEQLQALMRDSYGRIRDRSVPAGMVPTDTINEMLKSAEAIFHNAIVEVMKGTAKPFIQAVYDLETPRMVFGRTCLIGDAAFVARPHAAAGTAKACEDGWQLAQSFARGGDVDESLTSWQPAALLRGRGLVDRSRTLGERLQSHDRWTLGDPPPFGLYAEGDSQFE